LTSFDLPKESFYARKEIILSGIEQALSKSAEYIHQKYPRSERLFLAETFCKYELGDAPTARCDHLEKVGFFPWVESSNELDSALSLLVTGNYKNTYDALRRSIDLVITGSFFTLDNVDHDKARSWMASTKSTPNFKKAIEIVGRENSFQYCNENKSWENDLLDLYWRLCDVIHVKGLKNSFNDLAPKFSYISGVGSPSFHESSCCRALDVYIETVELVALTVSLSNPILLVGFDLDKKFGLNPPASGFYYPQQAENLLNLIPLKYHENIGRLIDEDQNIKCLTEWFNSLPDISEEEVKRQANALDLFKNTE